MKKRILPVLAVILLMALFTSCGKKAETEPNAQTGENPATTEPAEKPANETGEKNNVTLKVGASPIPHEEILKAIQPKLAEEGINLEIVTFTDYVQPNAALTDKQLDANFFQHQPYLDSYNKSNGTDLVSAGNVHIEPLALYSKKYTSLDKLPDKATIAIPNDPTNCGRALLLLASKNIITLKDPTALESTEKDIDQNPHGFVFKPLEAAMLPRTLEETDAAVINGNYAIESGLTPTTDALPLEEGQDARVIEGADSPYANIIAVRSEDKDNENIKKLVDALQSEDTKKFIEEKYKGGVIPAF